MHVRFPRSQLILRCNCDKTHGNQPTHRSQITVLKVPGCYTDAMMAKQRLNHRLGLSGYTTRLAAYGDRLVPPVCLLCYSAPDIGHGLCSHCQSTLSINHNPCPVCALPDHGPLPCRRCRENPPPYRAIVAPFVYAKPISHLIRHLKFRQRLELIRPLTELWLEAVAPMVEHAMRLIPVPMDHTSLASAALTQR